MPKRQPIYDLNDYLLNGTAVGDLLGYPSADGLRPIIPNQQQPEANIRNSEHPYMVYSFRTVGAPSEWWIRTDEVSYVIWGKYFEQLSEVANEILSELEAMDESAGSIMSYLYQRGTPAEYLFHYVRVLGSFSPEPSAQEAGRLGWVITLRYEYSLVNGKYQR